MGVVIASWERRSVFAMPSHLVATSIAENIKLLKTEIAESRCVFTALGGLDCKGNSVMRSRAHMGI